MQCKNCETELLKHQYEALGITFQNHRHGNGPEHCAAELGKLVFEIYPLPAGIPEADTTTRLGFEVENLDELIPKLAQAGWTIAATPAHNEWGYSAIVKDLDGRKVELTNAIGLSEIGMAI